MSVLVTGGAGYIGSLLVWDLLDHGETVTVVDNLESGYVASVAPEVELVIGDVADTSLMNFLIQSHRVDTIIHCAGSLLLPPSISDGRTHHFTDAVKSGSLIETANRNHVRNFVFCSTAAVYGAQDVPLDEKAPLSPKTLYASSKLMTENVLREASLAGGMKHAIVRIFSVAGADPKGRTGPSTASAGGLVKVASEVALGQRQYVEIFGSDYPTKDGTCIRDFIHVVDVARAIRLSLERLRRGGSDIVVNCGTGRGYTVREVLGTTERIAHRPIRVREAERRQGDAAILVADTNLARDEIGWSPTYIELDEIVMHALAWESDLRRRLYRD